MQLIELDETEFSQPMLEIFNHAIETSTALFDYKPRTPENMCAWFEGKRQGNHPVIGVVDDSQRLMGFASYGPFRAFPAYKYTVELSIYVHCDHRRKGIGDMLMEVLKDVAIRQGYHVLIGAIEAGNHASIRLHEKHGFKLAGKMDQVGFKFSRWLDVVFYQHILPAPALPSDG